MHNDHLGFLAAAQNSTASGVIFLCSLGLLFLAGLTMACIKSRNIQAAYANRNRAIAGQIMESAQRLHQIGLGVGVSTKFSVAILGDPDSVSGCRLWAEISIVGLSSTAKFYFSLDAESTGMQWLQDLAQEFEAKGWVTEVELSHEKPVAYDWLILSPNDAALTDVVE